MSTGTQVTLAEYLQTDYSPDCDYVDGEVVERNVGKYKHARLQSLLVMALGALEQPCNIRVLTEQRILVAANRVRVADLCAISRDVCPEEVLSRPPILVIEIVSPDDRFSRIRQVIEDYIAFRVVQVWLIDPQVGTSAIYTSESIVEPADGIHRLGNIEVAVRSLVQQVQIELP